MSETCAANGCVAQPHTRGFCESHYRKRVRMGLFGYRDAGPVLEHLAKLRDLGWTWQQIGLASGVSWSVPHGLWVGRYRRILADRERALLAVPLVQIGSHRGVNSAGIRRRIQALSWMGWPAHEIARRVGCPASTLRTLILPTRQPSRRLALRVAEVYEQLSHVPGPSAIAANKARGLGFAPPAAWDEDTIDDPSARPAGVRRSA